MKRTILAALLVFAFVASGCSDKPTESGGIKLGEAFQLKSGQSVEIPGVRYKLTFNQVLSDGRCPMGPFIYCFWEGMAQIEMFLDEGETAQRFDLGILGYVTSVDSGRHMFATRGSYRFTLLQLDPMPDGTGTDPASYTATLRVDKVTGVPVGSFQPVVVTAMSPQEIQKAHFALAGATIKGDTLTLDVGYTGGCQDHYFYLFMSPGTFEKSDPAQADLYLRHIDNDDVCDAYMMDSRAFGLRPIADQYEAQYGKLGPITLNLHEYSYIDSTSVVSVTYHPEL